MEKPVSSHQTQLGETVVSDEQFAEAELLQHGIAALDLLDKEDAAENSRREFLKKTRPGTESRADILAGPSYNGDEGKMNRAVSRAKGRFAVTAIRRASMVAYATHLGIPATEKSNRVEVPEEDRRRFSTEYAGWRVRFAGPRLKPERDMYRRHLETKLRQLAGEQLPDEQQKPGPSVNLEERAILLTKAINAMARRSMLSGLNVAVVDEQYNEPIFERYEEDTPRLDSASIRKRERLLNAARRDFWRASGFPELRASGLMSEHLLRRRARKMWQEFAGQFEHSPQQTLRVDMRKQLRGYIPEDRLPETSIEGL